MASHIEEETVMTLAEDLKPGNIVDLQGDKFADPDSSGDYDYAYAAVTDVRIHEVNGTTVVSVEMYHDSGEFTVDFPKGWSLPRG